MKHLRIGVGLGFLAAACFGLLVGLEIAGPNRMWASGRDLALVLIWTALLFGAAGGIIGCGVGALASAAKRGPGHTVFVTLVATGAVFAFLDLFGRCYPCHQVLDSRYPHLIFTPGRSAGMTVGVGLISAGIGAAIGAVGYALWRSWRRPGVRIGFIVALAAGIVAAAAASYHATPEWHATGGTPPRPEAIGGTPRLLVIIDEALTWDVADPLIEEGRLPALAGLVRSGVRADLATIRPCLSHPIWATVATGRTPLQHGIGSKISYAYPGMRRGLTYFDVPVNMMLPEIFIGLGGMGFGSPRDLGSRQRLTKAIWTIAGESGIEVGVAGWRITWPAEDVNGFMIAERLHEEEPADHVWPPDLEETVEQAIDALPEIELERFIPCPLERIARDKRAGHRLEKLKRNLANDLRYHVAAQSLLETCAPRLLALGFLSMDGISHNFYWEHSLIRHPDRYRLDPYLSRFTSREIVDCYGRVIENAYAFHDSLIGVWLEWVGEDGSVIIASDHGFEMNGSNHYYGAPGILVMYGGPFRKGASVEGATVYDIAPTVLYLLGLPVPQDMDGRVLTEAMDPAWLDSNPVRTIPTYE